MAHALIGLGSNLGDRTALLSAAVSGLSAQSGVSHISASRCVATGPIGGPPGQGEYLNAAAVLETSLAPEDLLDALRQIEQALGRQRDVHWGPRTVDLDLLLYDDLVLDSSRLTLPHPRLAVRRFVLEPAVEVAPAWIHPTIGWTIAQLLAHVRQHPRYLALAGPTGVGKTQLATRVAALLPREANVAGRLLLEPIDDQMLGGFYANPSGRAWDTELEFLRMRTEMLAAVSWAEEPGWIVSDFWFDQALAYAELWLTPQQRAAFGEEFSKAAQRVVSPKLLVVLDASTGELQRRIAQRGRPYEAGLEDSLLDALHENIDRLARRRNLGPVLHVASDNAEQVAAEVLAAVAGMQ